MKFTNIKLIIFDLDNTLYDQRIYFKKVIEEFEKNNDLQLNQTTSLIEQAIEKKIKDIFGFILEVNSLNSLSNRDELFKIYQRITTDLKIYKEFLPIFELLKNKKIKKVILTNGNLKAQKNKVKCLKVSNLFDEIVYARSFGRKKEKPHRSSFHYLLKHFKVSSKECIMVGDTYETDIIGAKKMNIHSFWLGGKKVSKQITPIFSHRQLLKKIKRLKNEK